MNLLSPKISPSEMLDHLRHTAQEEMNKIGSLGHADPMTDRQWRAIYAVDRAIAQFAPHQIEHMARVKTDGPIPSGVNPRLLIEVPLVVELSQPTTTP